MAEESQPERHVPDTVWRTGALVLLAVTFVLHAPDLVAGRGAAWTVLTSVTETWLLVGITVWALARLPVRQAAKVIGPWRTALIGLAGVLMITGQQVRNVELWPFTSWEMYTEPIAAQAYAEVELFHDGESQGPLPFDEVLPMASPRPFLGPLLPIADRAADGDDEALDLLERTLDPLAARVGDADTVVIRRCLVRDPTVARLAVCQDLIHVRVQGRR
jgi:hypothetical protein